MVKLFDLLRKYIFRKPELDIILFKILGIGGIAVSMITGVYSLTQAAFVSAAADFGAAVFSIILLYFVETTGKYIVGYVITEVAIFMGVFSVLFLTNGGIDGALPFFFSFAIIFTFLMFQDRMLIFMEALLTGWYIALCVLTYRNPDLLWNVVEGSRKLSEVLIGIFFSALPMGFIILFYIDAYKKQKKQAEEANLAKGVFLANMSHELRTPINSVLGFDEVILKVSNEEQTKEYAKNIRNSGRQLLDVINQILDFSRLESGREVLVKDDYKLDDLVNEMKIYGENEANRKGLTFDLEYKNDVCDFLYGDSDKLLRVALNLLSNAVKYTQEGGVTLRVKASGNANKDTVAVSIEVEDTGIGIKKEDIDTLFHSYERLDLLTNQKIQGTGLGLAISKHIVELFDREIAIKSEYGVGSSFSFTIDQERGKAMAEKQNSRKEIHFLAPDVRVLVVDDNDLNRKLIGILLQDTLMKLDMAGDAKQGLDMVENNRYDIILMDYMMPEIDGVQAMKMIRAAEENTGVHTPIFVLTADVVENAERKLLEAGFDAYVSKPIDFSVLKQKLLEFLPEDMVEVTDLSGEDSLTRAEIEDFNRELTPYDIHIADGLRYVGNNIEHFSKVVKFCIKNSDASMMKVQEALQTEDFQTLKLLFHSLKGNAKNVGALELNELARRLEYKSADGDRDYVQKATELALFEWKRTVEGLELFLDLLRSKRPELFEKVTDSASSNHKLTYDEWIQKLKELMEDLKMDIELYQSKSGINHVVAIQEMLADQSMDSAQENFGDIEHMNNKLRDILEALEEMEYDLAEELYEDMETKING